MSVSQREFYDKAYWKLKRYNSIIFQAGKNPADFEGVELQDISNYEIQQAVGNIINCGFTDDSFKVYQYTAPDLAIIYIKRGAGWIQDGTGSGSEYTGIRILLPDVLTNVPTLAYEHALDGATDYYKYTITSTAPPGAPNYRYDLLYVEFYRQEYTNADDSEMQDPVLGETAHREKWYYEFKYAVGDTSNKNPDFSDIPSLPAEHYGVRLAVIRRQNTKTITNEDIFDVRPKFALNSNVIGSNLLTVGANGGKYNSIMDIFGTQTGVAAITPTATNPYTICMLPGVHTVPFAIDTGTMGYIRIVGAGIDKTILEFDDIYALTPAIWLTIGASPFIEFADMTIRIKSTNTGDADLINISSGTVRFTNCKLGEVVAASATLVGGLVIANSTVTIKGCEINNRSTTNQSIKMTGTSRVRIYDSIIRQSKYRTIDNEATSMGYLKVYNSEIIGNALIFRASGGSASEFHDCLFSQQAWYSGDTVTGNSGYVVSPTKYYSCKFTATSGTDTLELEEEVELHDCSHDGTITVDNLVGHTMKFYGCSLTNIANVSSAASFSTLEFYGCDFLTSSITTVILNAIAAAKFMDCVFKKDGACIDFTDTDFDVKNCHFVVTTAVKVIDLKGTCVPNIQNCQFHLGNAGAVAIYMEATTATPIVTHCTFIGSSATVAIDAASAVTTIKAGDLDGDVVALKGANVTITDIRLA